MQVLLRWSIQRGCVRYVIIPIQIMTLVCFRFVPLPKSGNPERVVSNVDIFNFELSSEDMAQLDGLDKGDAGAISWNPVNCD